jgi:hypothetical protein
MLTNAVIAGAIGAGFVCVLILQFNPQVTPTPAVLLQLGERLWVFYGIGLAVSFYGLIVLAQLLSRDGFSPGWLSLRLLAWSSTLVAIGAAALMWANLRQFGLVLDADVARRIAAGAGATSVCALLLFIIASVHYSFGRRGSRVGGTLYALTIVAALGLPLAARGWGGALPVAPGSAVDVPAVSAGGTGRVALILLDGASLDFIATTTAAGRLPHLARLLDEGASMHLATIRPTHPGPVWAAVATGMYPPGNGIRSNDTYSFGATTAPLTLLPDLCLAHMLPAFGIIAATPNDATAFRARPLWQILSEAGVSVGVAGVPLTHPAPAVAGYLVSDRLHEQSAAGPSSSELDLVFPRHALASLPAEALELPAASGHQPPGDLPRDLFYRRIAGLLDERLAPRVRIVRYQGIDIAGHYYLRYAMPEAFGDVSPDERQRYGQVLEQQYGLIDDEIGRVMDGLNAGDLLLVVSGFGMEPQSVSKRLLARALREPDLAGTHESAPDGFLIAWGQAAAARRLPVGSVVDVVPTLLYFLGLPVARDMHGTARTDVFTTAFTADRPVSSIPSYGSP